MMTSSINYNTYIHDFNMKDKERQKNIEPIQLQTLEALEISQKGMVLFNIEFLGIMEEVPKIGKLVLHEFKKNISEMFIFPQPSKALLNRK